MLDRYFIKVEGIVQGVGFRPFVYNLALSLGLKGWVNNNSQGVFIDLEGSKDALTLFLKELAYNSPPLATIENISFEIKPPVFYNDFSIKDSEINTNSITLVSPDIATCQHCINDIKSSENRRFKYAFTNCTNCGPRFSIIKNIPYDRDETTMKPFTQCSKCAKEYTSPTNRRFHAQPNACPNCGPEVFIINALGERVEFEDWTVWTADALTQGKIFAIKSIGGFHLVCDATNLSAIESLRIKKHRPYKPFAVMARDLDTAKKYCLVTTEEETLLTGISKPIVILKTKPNVDLAKALAPNQSTLGLMLPFTPLHELLLAKSSDLLVMTSGNISSLPLEFTNERCFKSLSGIADYFLMHNRDIHIPVDDSIVRVHENTFQMLRRSRGYVPVPLKYATTKNFLACGSNLKNTFAISTSNFIFVSQHNGDLENLETFEHYKRNLTHFENIFNFKPEVVVCDLHPNYISTKIAEEYAVPKLQVQHHHAHIVSCMAENNITSEVIGLAFDGTGYGTDGAIWGGEFLACTISSFKRKAHLAYVPMVGGDKSIKEPWRMAISYLNYALTDCTEIICKLFGNRAPTLLSILNANLNTINTSSMGRFFDAISAILGICTTITYEGQASIELEALIDENVTTTYCYELLKNDNEIIISTKIIIKEILLDLDAKLPLKTIATKFHNTVVNFSVQVCLELRKTLGLNEVALSGGVFQNYYLLKNLKKRLELESFVVYIHKNYPCNDGGLSLGQLVIANSFSK